MSTEEQPQHLLVLRDIAQELSDVHQEAEALPILMRGVMSAVRAERAVVRLLSPTSESLVLSASEGLTEDSALRTPCPISDSSFYRRVLDGDVITVADLSSASDFPYRDAALGEGLTGVIAAPMRLRGRSIGVFEVYVGDGSVPSSADGVLIDTLSDLGAMALEKLRLHQSLYRIAAVLNAPTELTTMLQNVLEATVREMWLKAAAIRVLEPDGKLLRLAASHGLSETYLRKGDLDATESPIDQRVLRGETVVLRDIDRQSGLAYPEAMSKEGIRSILVVPLRFKDRTLGLVRVYSAHSREFGSVATAFLTSVADLVAVAIERDELYRALEARYEDLKLDLAEWRRFLALG